ncbi:cytochrome P450 [Mycena epipterygia]|nr:cytochrome P450 [Mycena epipterygia]
MAFLAAGAVLVGRKLLSFVPQATLQLFASYFLLQVLNVPVKVSVALYIMAYLASRLVRRRRQRSAASALGARLSPLILGNSLGNIDVLLQMREMWKHGYPGDMLEALAENHGSIFDLNLLWEDMIFTTCPEHLKIMLAVDSDNYPKGQRFCDALLPLGVGTFNTDGDTWKYRRSLTRAAFTRTRVSNFEQMDHNAKIVINRIKERMGAGLAIDFQDLAGRFVTENMAAFIADSSIGTLDEPLPHPHNSARPADHEVYGKQSRPSTDLSTVLTLALVHSARRLGPIIRDAVEKQKMSTIPSSTSDVAERQSMLNILVEDVSGKWAILARHAHTKNGHTDFDVIQDELLAMHPGESERVRSEIIDRVGPTHYPASEDLREMRYLRAFINEAMRLYPPVWVHFCPWRMRLTHPHKDPSQKEKPLRPLSGHLLIPPNHRFTFQLELGMCRFIRYRIAYSVLLMHRRKDLWGPDADVFDPDRFLDSRMDKYLLANPMQFLPSVFLKVRGVLPARALLKATARIQLHGVFGYSPLADLLEDHI